MKKKTSLFVGVLFCLTLCAACGSPSTESSTQAPQTPADELRYEENDAPLTYDEILLWAGDTATYMSAQKSESAVEGEDGTVASDYGHARIVWSGRQLPKILSLDMLEPNLACPRGVFIGNPLRKVTAYYPSVVEESGAIYRQETQRLGHPSWQYGYQEEGEVIYGAICEMDDGSHSRLEVVFEVEEQTVRAIRFTRSDGLSPEQAQAALRQIPS